MSANELSSTVDVYYMQVQKLQRVIETLQKQLALKELLIDELTSSHEDTDFEKQMPENIEKMMDTLLLNQQYTQIFLNRVQN